MIATTSLTAGAQDRPTYLDTTQPIDKRVDDLLGRLTVEEKLSLVHADSKFTTAAIARLGIPKRWLSDGPHGVREDVGPYTWDAAGHTDDFCTAMPAAICLAATWNPELAKTYGQVVGEEARLRGKDIMLGPSVNIQRTPLCGRNFEYMGEDPLLTSRLAVNYIQGMQSRDVAACIKHFALNNQEESRGSVNVEVDERTLREIYLPAFKAAVQEAGVLSVMGAYNKFRGEHCCENDLLLNKILKDEWGFKGLVMSDWSGVHDTRKAALGGLDLEMGTNRPYEEFYLAKPFAAAIASGEIPMAVLDDKARRNLYVMIATKVLDQDRATGSLNTKQHQAAARKVAEEGIVLLKNQQDLLPLNLTAVHSIAVIGDNAVRLHAAGGGAAGLKAFYEVSPFDGIVRRAGGRANVTFSQGYEVPVPRRRATTADAAGVRTSGRDNQPATTQADANLIDRAVAAAKAADVAIVIGGLNHNRFFDAEGADRKDMKLPYGQDELIGAVVEANPRTVVVFISGGAVEMGTWLEKTPALLQAWYGGMECGNALAGVLFGDTNPSGKLPCTFPKKLEDSPAHALHAYPGENGTVEYKEGMLVGYRWFDTRQIEPLFCFGHGLSYTHFEYSNLRVSPGDGNETALTLQCDITNTGDRDGAEVAQIYVHANSPRQPSPEKELKGFKKVTLARGEKQTINLSLPRHAFETYDAEKKQWVSEQGKLDVLVGSSSRDIRARANVQP